MTRDEKFNLARQLMKENNIIEGVELLEELLEENSDDLDVMLVAVQAECLMAYVWLDMGLYDDAIKCADKAIDLAVRLSQVDEIMETREDSIIGAYRSAYRYKGQAIFEMDMSNSECLEALEEAAKYNENEALYYLGTYYAIALSDCNPDNYDKFCSLCAKQAKYHEKYIENLKGEEDPERIKLVCNALADFYKDGLGVPKNKAKARFYKKMASK